MVRVYRSKLLREWGNLVEECQPQNIHTAQGSKKICIRVSSRLGQNSKQVGEQMPEHVHSQTSCLSHTIMKIIIIVNIVGGQMPWQRTVDMSRASLASVVDPPQGGVRSQICTARPPCRYHHPTCAVYFKIHFLENFKLFILRNTRMGEGIGLFCYNLTIWLWHSGVFTINYNCMSGGRASPNYFCYPCHRRGGEPIF